MSTDDGLLLTASVHRRLRQEIVDGTLAPGTPLSVPALAARLEVSRSPVRESVQQLIHEGLAVGTPRAGAKVASLDAATMRAALQVREVLDGLAARQATLHATGADVTELIAMVDAQQAVLGTDPDRRRDAELDLAFHTRIRELAGNGPLLQALVHLQNRGHLYRSDAWAREQDRRFSVSEHRRIVDAIAAGDAAGAEVAARAHVAGVCVRMMRPAG